MGKHAREGNVAVQFADWFERTHPGERYKLEQKDAGTNIVRADKSVITFREYYEHHVIGSKEV